MQFSYEVSEIKAAHHRLGAYSEKLGSAPSHLQEAGGLEILEERLRAKVEPRPQQDLKRTQQFPRSAHLLPVRWQTQETTQADLEPDPKRKQARQALAFIETARLYGWAIPAEAPAFPHLRQSSRASTNYAIAFLLEAVCRAENRSSSCLLRQRLLGCPAGLELPPRPTSAWTTGLHHRRPASSSLLRRPLSLPVSDGCTEQIRF